MVSIYKLKQNYLSIVLLDKDWNNKVSEWKSLQVRATQKGYIRTSKARKGRNKRECTATLCDLYQYKSIKTPASIAIRVI